MSGEPTVVHFLNGVKQNHQTRLSSWSQGISNKCNKTSTKWLQILIKVSNKVPRNTHLGSLPCERSATGVTLIVKMSQHLEVLDYVLLLWIIIDSKAYARQSSKNKLGEIKHLSGQKQAQEGRKGAEWAKCVFSLVCIFLSPEFDHFADNVSIRKEKVRWKI